MTISSTTRKAGPFVGNGVTTEFPFDFKLFSTSDLRVVRADTLGVETDLVHVTDCTVTLNADQDENPGGSVVLNAPLADGFRLVLLSAVPELQPVDLTNQGGFYPELVNGGLDRATVQVQQLREQMSRSITVPVTSEPGDLTLPSPTPGQLLGWTDSGLTNFDPSELVSVVAYGATRVDKFTGDGTTTAFTLSTSPGVQNNLRVSIGGVVQVPGEDFTWGGGSILTFAVAPPAATRIVVQYQQALLEFGAANADLSNVDPGVGRSSLGLAQTDTPEFATVALGTSPWTGGTADRTISQILRDAVMPSILEFGGIGDGVADDTAAMNTALAAGRGVFLPKYLPSGVEAVWYFASSIQLPVNAAVCGDYRLSKIKSGAGDVFRLAGGGRINIQNLYIDCAAQTAGGVAIKFLTGTSSFAYTKIENVDIAQAYGSVHDQNGAGEIIYSRIRYVRALEPRGTPFKFSDFVAYNFLDHCFVDLVPLAGNPAFVSFDINGGAGLVMDTCEVNGFGQGATPNAAQHAYLIQNQQALWMKNCFGDTTGGWGLRLISCAAALQDCTFGYNMEGQLYVDSCPDLTITGRLWAQGRKGLTPITASKSAVVIKNSARVQMTAGVIRRGTGAGLELEAVSDSNFTLTANDSSSHGVYVNGCSSLGIAVKSTANGGAGVRVHNSTSIEVTGHYLFNAAYGVEETGTSNYNRYSGGLNANGTANGILVGARSRAFNYHNAAGLFVLITPAANANVVGSAVF